MSAWACGVWPLFLRSMINIIDRHVQSCSTAGGHKQINTVTLHLGVRWGLTQLRLYPFFVTSFNWRRRKLSEMHLNWIQLLPVISGIDWPFYQRNPVLKPLIKPVSKFKYWSVIQSNFSTEIICKQCNFIHIMQKKRELQPISQVGSFLLLNSENRIELSTA